MVSMKLCERSLHRSTPHQDKHNRTSPTNTLLNGPAGERARGRGRAALGRPLAPLRRPGSRAVCQPRRATSPSGPRHACAAGGGADIVGNGTSEARPIAAAGARETGEVVPGSREAAGSAIGGIGGRAAARQAPQVAHPRRARREHRRPGHRRARLREVRPRRRASSVPAGCSRSGRRRRWRSPSAAPCRVRSTPLAAAFSIGPPSLLQVCRRRSKR